jgi:hypothetical protein
MYIFYKRKLDTYRLKKSSFFVITNGFYGCQIFLGTTYQNGGNIRLDHKIHQMDIKYTDGYKVAQLSIK